MLIQNAINHNPVEKSLTPENVLCIKTAMSKYPLNTRQLIADPRFAGKEDFFLLFNVYDGGHETVLYSPGDTPLAVNKAAVRDEIFANSGVKLPTRAEVSNHNLPVDLTADIDHTTLFTGAVGAALWRGGEILLVQNDGGKPINPLRFNHASGLLSGDPIEKLLQKLNSETAILIPNGDELTGLNIHLPPGLPQVRENFRAAVFGAREGQHQFIQANLASRYQVHAGKKISWVETTPQEMPQRGLKKIQIDIAGRISEMTADVFVDAKAQSVNAHVPMSLKNGRQAVVVDAERWDRNIQFYALANARELDLIEGPRAYLEQLAANIG